MSEQRADIHTRVTNRIVAGLEQGMRPWPKPWSVGHMAGKITRPLGRNGIPDQGINVVMLWSAAVTQGYACPIWLTFKQAQQLGGNVRKGEHHPRPLFGGSSGPDTSRATNTGQVMS